MKFILMLLMLSSLLFSGQKQIILGSYSVVSNGERALETINEQIKNDIKLQDFMKEHSLRTINTVISDYTVVSINAFDSYKDLLGPLKVLKEYYGDAFVLKYPTKNIAKALSLAAVEEKVAAQVAKEEAEDEEKRAELKKLLEQEELESQATEVDETSSIEEEVTIEESVAAEAEEVEQKAVTEEIVEEETVVEESVVDDTPVEEHGEEETSTMQEYIMYLIVLAVLALLGAGFTVYKISNSGAKKQKKDE